MALIAKNQGSDFELPPQETALAVCVGVIDLGDQENTYFNKVQRQVLVMWELPELLQSNDQPHTITKFYTLSLYETSHLRKDLESWRGKAFTEEEIEAGFDLKKLLGQWCYIGIVHKEKASANGAKKRAQVQSIAKIRASEGFDMKGYKPSNAKVYFDFDNFNYEEFKQLPPWIQNIMKNSTQMKGMDDEVPPPDEEWDGEIAVDNDDIPF